MSFLKRLKEKTQEALHAMPILVTDEEAEARMAICLECPALRKSNHQCRECGCLMNAKTKLVSATCPLGKW